MLFSNSTANLIEKERRSITSIMIWSDIVKNAGSIFPFRTTQENDVVAMKTPTIMSKRTPSQRDAVI